MAEGFYRRRDDWMRSILQSRHLTRTQQLVAFNWALQFLNAKSEEAWPAARTLAQSAGVSEKTVYRTFQQLQALGYLKCCIRRGRNSKTYRMIYRPELCSGDPESRNDQSTRPMLDDAGSTSSSGTPLAAAYPTRARRTGPRSIGEILQDHEMNHTLISKASSKD